MGLLERVTTLIRANLNDMVDRAEDPEKMIKQVILDMENQYLQVKTQVAVSIADQHMLEKKWRENEDSGKDWMRKAEIAVDKSEDDLARAALDRFQTSQRLALSYREQVDDQKAQVETLKGALVKLEQKLDEAKAKHDLLLARHRRSIALSKAARAQTAIGDNSNTATFDRLKDRVHHTEAVASAEVELLTDDTVERLTRLDRDVEVDRRLEDAAWAAASVILDAVQRCRVTGVIMNCNTRKQKFIPAEIPKACSRPIPSTSSKTIINTAVQAIAAASVPATGIRIRQFTNQPRSKGRITPI